MKQNTKANAICQSVAKTKTLSHENISTKITENITQNSPNVDICSNNSKTHEAINETTKKIPIPSDLICNVIEKNQYRVQQIQNNCNVKIYTKFQNRSIQDIKVTGNEHQVNMSLNEINNTNMCKLFKQNLLLWKTLQIFTVLTSPKSDKQPTSNLQ